MPAAAGGMIQPGLPWPCVQTGRASVLNKRRWLPLPSRWPPTRCRLCTLRALCRLLAGFTSPHSARALLRPAADQLHLLLRSCWAGAAQLLAWGGWLHCGAGCSAVHAAKHSCPTAGAAPSPLKRVKGTQRLWSITACMYALALARGRFFSTRAASRVFLKCTRRSEPRACRQGDRARKLSGKHAGRGCSTASSGAVLVAPSPTASRA